MTYNINEVVTGALLHDIGKLIQRAYGSFKNIDWDAYDMESTLCPKGKYQNYTHQHVLFTNAFFDLFKKHMTQLPEGLDIDKISNIASFHHNPENAPDSSIAWIITQADRYSAGMDRKSDDEGDYSPTSRETYRRLPLKCIFDEIIIDPNRKFGISNAYNLGVLDPHDPNALIPHSWNGEDLDMPDKYMKIWNKCYADFVKINKMPKLTNRLFEEIVLSLLERYTWAIPSSTMDIPDISLYDHSRTTAAISACLYRYHEMMGELGNKNAIKNDTQQKFRFISGDLSGLQSTLFTLESQGVKGVNKILRARSFMLGAISEAASIRTLDAFGLPVSCLIQQAGGRFLILVPNVQNIQDVLNNLRGEFDSWLLENYSGSLALNMAMTKPFPGQSFKAGDFENIMDELAIAVENAKQHPLSTCVQGVMKREFPYDRSCSACGIRPAQVNFDNEYRCVICQKEVETGKRLTSSAYMVWAKSPGLIEKPLNIMGIDLFLIEGDKTPEVDKNTLSIRSLKLENSDMPWAFRILANHIPRFESEYDLKRYEGISETGEENLFFSGMPKTFAHIGAEAKECDEKGKYKGKPFLGLLKADVDYLGFIFSFGLKQEESKKNRFTLSRLAQLSRMMDLYFTGYLQGVIKREFPDTYTIYAGGDDLLLIGPWFQMHALAKRMHETFSQYTGYNPNITISAGLSLMHSNYPVNRAVQDAEEFLKLAKNKDEDKNKICALMKAPKTWEQFASAIEDADWIHKQMNGKSAVSTGFVYHILEIAKDAEAVARGDVNKAGWRAKLAYHLARNIKGHNKRERDQNILNWLERIGLDDLCRLTQKDPNIIGWRLPISIALYRNRK